MSDGVISDVAGWVMQHGRDAEAVLQWDAPDDAEPLSGLTDAERDAIDAIEPHLRSTWVDLLTATRAALWAAAGRHRFGKAMQRPKNTPAFLWKHTRFVVNVVPGTMSAGVSLEAWGEDRVHLWGWIWTATRLRSDALTAARKLLGRDGVLVASNGNLHLSLGQPKTGDRYVDLAKGAAKEFWPLVKTVGEAVERAR